MNNFTQKPTQQEQLLDEAFIDEITRMHKIKDILRSYEKNQDKLNVSSLVYIVRSITIKLFYIKENSDIN